MDIFEYQNYRTYLKDKLRNGPQSGNTLKALAQKLGYASPRSIGMVITGSRIPSNRMVQELSTAFQLSEREHVYFELLVERERRQNRRNDDTKIRTRLAEFNPEISNEQLISEDESSLLNPWYMAPLYLIVQHPDFKEDYAWLDQIMGRKVTIAQLRWGIKKLLEMGVLSRKKDGSLKVKKTTLVTSRDIPNGHIKNHHSAMVRLGIDALQNVAVQNREMNSLTILLDPKEFAKAKAEIIKFQKSFSKRFHAESGSMVYQFNMQFFPVTQPK